MFEKLCPQFGLPLPEREHRFHPARLWRFDFAFVKAKVALEVEGGIYGYKDKKGNFRRGGAHSSITGIKRDIEKYNAAALLGWRVLRVTPEDLLKIKTLDMMKQILTQK